jgi:predicted PurR-regulated permease PerM
MRGGAWSRLTRERFFYGALAVSTASVLWLFWPFLEVIVFAGVIAAVGSPLNERLVARLGGRRILAAVLVTLLFCVVVALPVVTVLYLFSIEAVEFVSQAMVWFTDGRFEQVARDFAAWANGPALESVRGLLGPGKTSGDVLVDPIRNATVATLGAVSGLVPRIVEGIGHGILDALLFVFSVVTLLSEGPRLLAFLLDLLPLDERYQRQLLQVFREFASRMVVGAFAVALAQGTVATVGYVVFGVPSALFFGVITGVASFVPLIGTSIVAIPMVAYVGWLHGWPYGVGLAAWSLFVVGTVDNLIRPLILRGSSDIHPLLIFLAVFGGLRWMGLAGVLIGPVLVAFFLALATIHREQREEPPAIG